jgi:hypothetical protein
LVWQDQFEFDKSAYEFEAAAQTFLIREEHTSEWPGTEIFYGHQATVRHYQLTDSSIILLAKTHALYAWLAPTLPEDLAFYSEDNKCWLLSISHEKDSAIIDQSITIQELQSAVPGLIFRVEEG